MNSLGSLSFQNLAVTSAGSQGTDDWMSVMRCVGSRMTEGIHPPHTRGQWHLAPSVHAHRHSTDDGEVNMMQSQAERERCVTGRGVGASSHPPQAPLADPLILRRASRVLHTHAGPAVPAALLHSPRLQRKTMAWPA